MLYCWYHPASGAELSLVPIPWTGPSLPGPGPGDDLVQVVLELDRTVDAAGSCGPTAAGGAVPRLCRDVKCRSVPVPDARGDFISEIAGDNFAADLVHCYSAARIALQPFLDDRRRVMGSNAPWEWAFGTSRPLRIVAHAGEREDSCYHRGSGSLKFFHVTTEEGRNYLCRGFDVVAHETGHAILDALNPSLYSAKSGQVAAFHEAFADIVAVFSLISVDCLVQPVFDSCRGNLRAGSSMTSVGSGIVHYRAAVAQAGDAAGNQATGRDMVVENARVESHDAVRNLNNDVNGFSCSREMYSLASLFSGFVWDVVVGIYTEWGKHSLLSLQSIVRYVRILLTVVVVKDVSAKDLTFTRVAEAMAKRAAECSAMLAAATAAGKVDDLDCRPDAKCVVAIIEQCAKTRQLDAVNSSKGRFRATMLGDF